eukprot:3941592-Rhodomonas_salina.2
MPLGMPYAAPGTNVARVLYQRSESEWMAARSSVRAYMLIHVTAMAGVRCAGTGTVCWDWSYVLVLCAGTVYVGSAVLAREGRAPRRGQVHHEVLLTCEAMSGTRIAHGRSLRACYAMSSTGIAHASG